MDRRSPAVLLLLVPAVFGLLPLWAATDFIRGDTDNVGGVQITDAIRVFRYLFLGETITCLDAADADDDGRIQINDGIFILNSLFLGGAVPASPFPFCGEDPTEDSLGCRASACSSTFVIAGQEIAADAVFFVVDRSGSMQNTGELRRAQQIITGVLENDLSRGDEFGITFFDSGVLKFPSSGMPARATAGEIAVAARWVAAMRGGGGSCVQQGFLSALGFVDSAAARNSAIIYIGDGGGTCAGRSETQYLAATLQTVTEANQGRARIYTFGVLMRGRPRQENFLRELAEANGGTYTPVS